MPTLKEHRHKVYDYLASIGVNLNDGQKSHLSSVLKEYVRDHNATLVQSINELQAAQQKLKAFHSRCPRPKVLPPTPKPKVEPKEAAPPDPLPARAPNKFTMPNFHKK